MATFDSVLTRDSNGHHGVSVGRRGRRWSRRSVRRAAGRTAQSPVPQSRRLDVRGHHRPGGRGRARRHGAVALRRRRQRRRSGSRAWRRRPARCCSSTTARGTSRPSRTPSRSRQPLQGVLTSITMADYDRDGFLDLYVCVYSYFFGAGEDKAGTPAPYYDARNGPPGVLFRNDGHGRFVDGDPGGGSRRRQRSLSLRGGLGRLRRRRLARSAGRERFRDQEPVSQPRVAETAP